MRKELVESFDACAGEIANQTTLQTQSDNEIIVTALFLTVPSLSDFPLTDWVLENNSYSLNLGFFFDTQASSYLAVFGLAYRWAVEWLSAEITGQFNFVAFKHDMPRREQKINYRNRFK